jgi:hypothetical protein
MPSKELVKPACAAPAATTDADASPPSLMVVVSELVARESGGVAWCLGRGCERTQSSNPRSVLLGVSVAPSRYPCSGLQTRQRRADYLAICGLRSYSGREGGLNCQPAAYGMFDCCTRRKGPQRQRAVWLRKTAPVHGIWSGGKWLLLPIAAHRPSPKSCTTTWNVAPDSSRPFIHHCSAHGDARSCIKKWRPMRYRGIRVNWASIALSLSPASAARQPS